MRQTCCLHVLRKHFVMTWSSLRSHIDTKLFVVATQIHGLIFSRSLRFHIDFLLIAFRFNFDLCATRQSLRLTTIGKSYLIGLVFWNESPYKSEVEVPRANSEHIAKCADEWTWNLADQQVRHIKWGRGATPNPGLKMGTLGALHFILCQPLL